MFPESSVMEEELTHSLGFKKGEKEVFFTTNAKVIIPPNELKKEHGSLVDLPKAILFF